MTVLLVACQTDNSYKVMLEEIVVTFEKHDNELEKDNLDKNDILGMKLKRVKPYAYKVEDKKLFIYIFDSDEQRKEGLQYFLTRPQV